MAQNTEEETWDDWEEAEQPAICPLDQERLPSAEACIQYLRTKHDCDLMKIAAEHALDHYGCIRLINFMRKHQRIPASRDEYATDDAYLQPVMPEDALLQYDFFPEEWSDDEENEAPQSAAAPSSNVPMQTPAPLLADASNLSTEELRQLVAELQTVVREQSALPASDLQAVRQEVVATPQEEDQGDGSNDSEGYFAGYARVDIHEEMLRDVVRTESYRDYILNNPSIFQDKVVLDVGCGSGILSMFAAKAGAKHVYAVDNSSIVHDARAIVFENGLSDKITVLHGKVEEVALPPEGVDVIVSEWMGYFLLFESMLDSVLCARDRCLRPGGVMAPDQSSMYLAALDDACGASNKLGYWNDVYGFRMPSLQRRVLRDAWVTVVPNESVVSNRHVFQSLDMNKCSIQDLTFARPFTLVMNKATRVTALLSYFDIVFDNNGEQSVYFSTGPEAIPTHWQQTVFLLENPVEVSQGDHIEGNITVARAEDHDESRTLTATIEYHVKQQSNGESGATFSQTWRI
ncbi:uncharacterized protein MONBRDRAFT_32648 [Monosiga brevicollis MX1]|uniref:type I protein arginine methyltransferase n=1 Tax=Monosiga brevicollis TaxID=81824 RepID=A9V0W8_MONBE|nr:uncharacterized protein MONBRDRAFT_32648 [Monosiga brevicollis MX1]EDQ88829.1 predicted protein [Monosiga brevicollis MX1]|eukprot:XP_001746442.1 hypothetical protein [Monosiga brevicollis MX1]